MLALLTYRTVDALQLSSATKLLYKDFLAIFAKVIKWNIRYICSLVVTWRAKLYHQINPITHSIKVFQIFAHHSEITNLMDESTSHTFK